MTWRSIADGPPLQADEFLAWSRGHGYSFVHSDNWIERHGAVEYFNGDAYCPATHWWDFGDGQPLPPPPEKTT